MKTFELHHHEDASGVSGTGVVAEGVVFTDGTCALHWRGDRAPTGVYGSVDDVIAIHGHEGRIQLVYVPAEQIAEFGAMTVELHQLKRHGNTVQTAVNVQRDGVAIQRWTFTDTLPAVKGKTIH